MESGTRLGPYEVQEQLGAGGMGEVYLAQDTRLGRNGGVVRIEVSVTDGVLRLGPPSLVVVLSGKNGVLGNDIEGGFFRDFEPAADGRILIHSTETGISEELRGHVIVVRGWLDEVVRRVAEAQ